MTLQLIGTNRSGSPTLSLSAGNSNAFAWSPFGEGAARTGSTTSLPGFNSERQDPLSGMTHLGNGYRSYSPALRRFTCPDSESPFGIGGINPYVYCDNDPVNKTDPSGHGPITWLVRKVIRLGVRLGVASAETAEGMASGLTTAGAVETGTELATQVSTGISQQIAKARGNIAAATELGWITMGMGLAGGLGLMEGDIGQTVRRARGAAKSFGLLGETESEVSSLFGSEGNYRRIGDDVSEVRESLMEESSDREPLRSRSTIRESAGESNLVNNAEFSLSDLDGSVRQNGSGEPHSFVDHRNELENVSRQAGSVVGETGMPQLPEHIAQAQGRPKGARFVGTSVFDPGEQSARSLGSGRNAPGKGLLSNTLHSWARVHPSNSKLKPGASRYIKLV